MKKVLVTGSSGMIGRAVVQYLSVNGFAVRAHFRGNHSVKLHQDISDKDILDKNVSREPIEHVELDLVRGNKEEYLELVRGCDAVVHCAALVHKPNAPAELFTKCNVEATQKLAMAAANVGVKTFVFLSTVAVYGDHGFSNACENDPLMPMTPYAVSKYESEKWLKEANLFERTIVLRPALVFGEGDRGNMQKLIKAIAKGRYVKFGGKQSSKSLIYVRDLALAIKLCLDKAQTGYSLYNVANPESVTLSGLADIISRVVSKPIVLPTVPLGLLKNVAAASQSILGSRSPVSVQQIEKLSCDSTCNVSALVADTDFSPRYLLDEAIKNEFTWLREPTE